MKILPLSEEKIREHYLGSRLSAVQDVARAAQADALRQVIIAVENDHQFSAGLELQENKIFKYLQSALTELEKEIK